MLGTLLAALDQTILATALPRIAADLHGFDHLSWAITAYLVTSTVTVPFYGRLSDVYGRRLLFVVSISLFGIGSVLSGLAGGMVQLIAFRALQGLGAGGLMPLAQAVVADLFEPRDRGRYQGFIGGMWALAAVAGPILGGTLTDHASWRWIFFINVPLCVLALAVVIRTLPPARERREHRFDLLGAALLSAAVTGVLLACVWGGVTYPWGSAEVLGTGIAGLAGLVAFVAWERRAAEPLVPIALFSNRVFAVGCAANVMLGALIFGVDIYVPVFVQGVLGSSATGSGMVLLPLLLSWTLVSALVGAWISRSGRYKAFPIAGMTAVLAGCMLLVLVGTGTSRLVVTLDLLLVGVGMGAAAQVFIVAAQNAVDPASIGLATGGLVFFRNMGATLSVAALGTILANRLASALTTRLGAGAGRIDTQSLLQGGLHVPAGLEHGTRLALSDAAHTVFLALVPVALVAVLLSVALPELALRGGER
jgi:EmrB/QacA subfamily drug resistance transporter